MELGSLGLRAAGELPGDNVYRAHFANYMVTEAGVAVEEFVPVSPLQTPEEIGDWERDEAVRAQTAARRGVQFGKHPRDEQVKPEQTLTGVEAERDSADAAEMVSIHAMPAKSSAVELATAERVLRAHSSYIKPANKRLL